MCAWGTTRGFVMIQGLRWCACGPLARATRWASTGPLQAFDGAPSLRHTDLSLAITVAGAERFVQKRSGLPNKRAVGCTKTVPIGESAPRFIPSKFNSVGQRRGFNQLH